MDLMLGIAIGYVAAQFLSVANLKAMYATARKWLSSLGKNGVGDADDYKVGGSD